jgi:hypothetical protein
MEIILKELPRKYKKVKMDRVYDKLVRNKIDFFVRRGSECNELIYDKEHRVYSSGNKNFPNDKIFLFNIVQQDCKKFLAKYSFVELPPKVNVSEYNYDYEHGEGVITGTDLDHAFWRIAYVKGYISKKTYDYGLDDRAKALRLATLSVLGREKSYEKFVEGEFVELVILKQKDEKLQSIYKDIRYSCYYMMYELATMLGNDFDCWRTDCIYYRDTLENRKIVHDYFEEREMMFKQLVYNSMDAFSIAETETEITEENNSKE